MMNKWILLVGLSLIVMSCLDKRTEEEALVEEETNLIDNLPLSDRDLLLAPLESALNDVASAMENDDSYEKVEQKIDVDGWTGMMHIKLDDGDTAFIQAEWSNQDQRFMGKWFWDDASTLFYYEIRHSIEGIEKRHYKTYFEDKGSVLSLYGKTAFGEDKLPNIWTPVCLTPEEEVYYSGMLRSISPSAD